MKLRAFFTVVLLVMASQLSAAFVIDSKADFNKWKGHNSAIYLPTGCRNGSGAVKFTMKNV